MKNIKYIAFALMLIFVASCTEDELYGTGEPAKAGDFIVFGARAGFEYDGPKTRTEYGGQFEYNNTQYERVNWIDNDKVEILCLEAAQGSVPCAYVVGGSTDATANTENSWAMLQRLENAESSLQWGSNGDHTFYGMYPSSLTFGYDAGSDEAIKNGIYLEKNGDDIILHGKVLERQTYKPGTMTYTEGVGYKCLPNMDYAYMVAKEVAKPADGAVELNFIPLVTALEVTLFLPTETADVTDVDKDNNTIETLRTQSINVGEVRITGNGIVGNFTANLSGWDQNGGGYPVTTVDNVEGHIVYSVYNDSKPLTIKPGESLTFTVFLAPNQCDGRMITAEDITIGVSDLGVIYKTKVLSNANLKSHYLTKISNLYLPAEAEGVTTVVDLSNWMNQLDGGTQFKRLSLPGSGGSFTKDGSSGYQQQFISFEDQWKMGIRAFEVSCDKPDKTGTKSLGESVITCNKINIGNTTIDDVYKDLVELVTTYHEETAVLIITYQSEGAANTGAGFDALGGTRNATHFAQSLETWYDGLQNTDAYEYKSAMMKYDPELTLAEAKGHVLVLVRINQRDENEDGSWDGDNGAKDKIQDCPALLINGCGTGRDKWHARGYKVGGKNVLDYSINSETDETKRVEDSMESGYLFTTTNGVYTNSSTSHNVTRPAQGVVAGLNFEYVTNDDDIKCWFQEWARVVQTPVKNGYGLFDAYTIYWHESYSEKLSHAKLTFDLAISDNEQYRNFLFINSLSGFFATSSIGESVIPNITKRLRSFYGGSTGDIENYANKINEDFYQYVIHSGMNDKTGPTGIVIIDRLNNTDKNAASYILPQIIISNNFKMGYGDAVLPDYNPAPGETPGDGGEG